MADSLIWARVQFMRQMQTLVRANIPLLRCLEIARRQTSHPALERSLQQIISEVRMGTKLSRAAQLCPGVISPLQAQALHAAEIRGSLDQVFEELAEWDEKDYHLHQRLVAALSYPILVVAVSILGLLLLVRFLLPLIISVSRQLGKEPPLPTRLLVEFGSLLQNPLALLVGGLGLALCLWGLRGVRLSTRQRLRLDRIRLRLPLIGPMVVAVATIRVSRSLGTLLASGLSMITAVELAGISSGSLLLRSEVFEPAADHLRGGDTLSQALRHDRYLPRSFHGMLAVGEQTGDLEAVLMKLADVFEMELEMRLEALLRALEPLLIVGVGFLVLGLMVIGFLPLYDLLRGLA